VPNLLQRNTAIKYNREIQPNFHCCMDLNPQAKTRTILRSARQRAAKALHASCGSDALRASFFPADILPDVDALSDILKFSAASL
jgi:hypothetical protein